MSALEEIHWRRQSDLARRVRLLERQMCWVLQMLTGGSTPTRPSLVSSRRITDWLEIAGTVGKIAVRLAPWVYVGAQAAWRWLLPYIERVIF